MSAVSTTAAQQQGPDALERARALLREGNLAAAERIVVALIDADGNDAEALYILAVCKRFAGDNAAALDAIAKLQALRPAYGRAWQEQGHVLRAQGDNSGALRAFRHAVSRNNSLVASWQAIAEIAAVLFKQTLARDAFQEFQKLAALPPELLSVRNMISEGKLFKAERLCRQFLKENPKHVEGMRLLADLGVRSEVLDDAEFLLESAIAFEPDNRLARYDYMNVLYRRQKYAQSLAQAEWLRDAEPDNEAFEIAYANQCVAVGRYEDALEIYDQAIDRHEDAAMLHLLRGHALKTVGRADDAVAAYQHAYAARADFGDAFWSLANLKTYSFTDTEMHNMRAAEADATTSLTDRIHLCFALGKALEDVGDYAGAFEHYERGNRLKRDEASYDADRMTARLQLQAEQCTPALFDKHGDAGCDAPDPIFIVGLPRAGSTLLEQILASHPDVDGTFELPNIAALAHRLGGRHRVNEQPRYPARLHELTAEQLEQFGQAFIDDTRVHRAGAPRFTDKMPNNFRHIGLINLILPNARIIDARRHPMACCFSGFKQLFATGQDFTYGLREIGQYYRDYVALMDHWDSVLPGKILRVQYEDVVSDTEAQVRRLLDFCGLEFNQACVDFHQTERSVRTPSAEQVRQPIYTAGLDQWQRFEPWLDPLKEALGASVRKRYDI